MRKSRLFKGILSITLSVFILQVGLIAYSMAYKRDNSGQSILGKMRLFAAGTPTDTGMVEPEVPEADAEPTIPTVTVSSAAVATGDASDTEAAVGSDVNNETEEAQEIRIPAEVLELIRQADPGGYDRNVANYKEFLARLNVHKDFQNGIEDMIRDGKKLSDILIAYCYLNDKYGTQEEVKAFVDDRTAGKAWRTLFEEYDKANPGFTPQTFDPVYLEELMQTDGITKDDIMIADRVAQKLSIPFAEVMQKRTGKMSWKNINAGYGIVNGQEELPYIPVEPETVKKLMKSSGLPEQSIIQAFVAAYKLDATAEAIIAKIRSGYSKARIYAEYLVNQYE